jgi:hypothetical protein
MIYYTYIVYIILYIYILVYKIKVKAFHNHAPDDCYFIFLEFEYVQVRNMLKQQKHVIRKYKITIKNKNVSSSNGSKPKNIDTVFHQPNVFIYLFKEH